MLVSPINDTAELTQVKQVFSIHREPESESEPLLNTEQHVAIFDAMPNGLVVLNNKGKVIQANAQANSLLGVPLLQQLWRDIIELAFDPKANDGHEVSLKNGLLVKVSTSPLANQLGQLIVITDLTETRLLQARISHMQRLSSLGRMVATLAHQIRTPLSSALLYAENLKAQDVPFAAREKFSGKIVDRLKELETQVNDMLLFAKSGDKQVIEQLTLSCLIGSVAENITGIEEKYGHRLQYEFSVTRQELASYQILGNKAALNGALENLNHNAFQVTRPERTVTLKIEIEIEIESESESQSQCHLSIIDEGTGLQEKHLTQIFTPFFTTKTHGTGLGLAVVQSVAKSHHGHVTAQNNAHQGATFMLSIPCQYLNHPTEK